jgi:ribose/xylose/arabinose/galactoside ABC-type transport system permease subunit
MTTTVEKMPPAKKMPYLAIFRGYGLIWALVLLCAVASLTSSHFLQAANLVNVLRQIALSGILGVGLTFVILTAGIDISVGAIVGVVVVVGSTLLNRGLPIWSVLCICPLVGALFGMCNGAGVTHGKVPPFIMTLGMMVMARGLAFTLSGGQPVALSDDVASAIDWLGNGNLLGIPVPVWIFAMVCAISFVILRYTPYGRTIYAVGSNPEAARLSGINVRFTLFSVYLISGMLAGVTGMIFISRLSVGEPSAGTGMELEAITIAVIGGTSLFGGEGGVIGTIIGAAILVVLANFMNLMGVSPFSQQIVKGAIIICAVLFEMRKRK